MAVPPALAVRGIEKRFPGVRALGGVSFDCLAGEIHALVGENGAGKSTLMRVLSGVHQPDAGVVLVNGRPAVLASPHDAQALGIAMVHQDTRLVPDLDVAQNIWLGREPGGRVLVDRAAMEQGAQRLLDRLDLHLDLAAPVCDLAVSELQLVEIVRALTTEPAALILDEPTSALDPYEAERLFAILRDLRAGGTGIVFISHRLPEVLAIADRITVMRDGEVVGTLPRREASEEQLVSMMVGRPVSMAYPPRAGRTGPIVLEVQDLASGTAFAGISLSAAAGEVLGLGGILGNGQSELARALFGLLPYRGAVRIAGREVGLTSPRRAIEAGLIYVPGDRRREGLFLPHAIRRNIAVPHLRRWSWAGIVSRREEEGGAAGVIAGFAVRTPSADQAVGLLSGGNQQKIVLGRWSLGQPKVYVFEEPTQGVDVATKLEIYRRIRAAASAGAAVLVISSDLLELIGLSDRIAVLAGGRVVDMVPARDATEERIIGSAVRGGRQAAPAAVPGPTIPDRRRALSGTRLLGRYGNALLLAGLITALAAFTATRAPYFLTTRNLGDLALQVTPLALVALGQLATVLLGGIDLSVGPVVSLVTTIASFLLTGEGAAATLGGVLACLAAGLAVGAANAALILRLRIPDLVATLATYSMVTGAALLVRPSPGGMLGEAVTDRLTAQIGPVPAAAVAVVLAIVLTEWLLVRGRLGPRLYAVGSSEEAAYVVGIPVGRVRAGAYLFCSLCAALAGLLIAARIGSGDPQAGAGFTLSSITAVVIGGASVFGGRGTAVGTLAGAVLVGLMQNALNHLHVSAYLQYVWTGLLTLLAVAAYGLRSAGPRR